MQHVPAPASPGERRTFGFQVEQTPAFFKRCMPWLGPRATPDVVLAATAFHPTSHNANAQKQHEHCSHPSA